VRGLTINKVINRYVIKKGKGEVWQVKEVKNISVRYNEGERGEWWVLRTEIILPFPSSLSIAQKAPHLLRQGVLNLR
jgi:hypothetical protein